MEEVLVCELRVHIQGLENLFYLFCVSERLFNAEDYDITGFMLSQNLHAHYMYNKIQTLMWTLNILF